MKNHINVLILLSLLISSIGSANDLETKIKIYSSLKTERESEITALRNEILNLLSTKSTYLKKNLKFKDVGPLTHSERASITYFNDSLIKYKSIFAIKVNRYSHDRQVPLLDKSHVTQLSVLPYEVKKASGYKKGICATFDSDNKSSIWQESLDYYRSIATVYNPSIRQIQKRDGDYHKPLIGVYNPDTSLVEWRNSPEYYRQIAGVYNPTKKQIEWKVSSSYHKGIAGAYNPVLKQVEWKESADYLKSIVAVYNEISERVDFIQPEEFHMGIAVVSSFSNAYYTNCSLVTKSDD